MLNEQNIRQALDNRLSGLTASEARRMRIRAAVNQERREATPVRSKKTLIIAIALIMVMLTSAIAVAEGLNLFDFFGKQDERFTLLAPEATLEITEDMLIEHPYLGSVKAEIDSAYFNGDELMLAYRISNATCAEEYNPSAEEIAQMQMMETEEIFTSQGDYLTLPAGFSLEDIAASMVYAITDSEQSSVDSKLWSPVEYEEIKTTLMGLLKNDPDLEVIVGYNAALLSGTAYGYKRYNIYVSDHTFTDDGIDIEPESVWKEFQGSDLCAMMEFRTPLEAVLRNRESLTVTKKVYQQESIVWFDGKNCWISRNRQEIGEITAVIPRITE